MRMTKHRGRGIQIKTRTLKLMMLTDVGAVHGQSLLIK